MANPVDPNNKPRLTLRRLVVAIALFGVAVGLFRLAAFQPRTLLACTGVVLLATSLGVVTRRFVISVAAVFSVAIISWVTTSFIGSGGFPACELNIKVVDESDQPISGAAITAFDKRGIFEPEYLPFAILRDGDVTSDSSGNIVIHQDDTIRYSCHGYSLFWCIPIGNMPPDVRLSVTHSDFVTEQLGFYDLFYSQPQPITTSVPSTFGHDVEARLIKHRVVLKRR